MSNDLTQSDGDTADSPAARYWRANISLLVKLLLVWFVASFGAGILFVDQLNAVEIFGFKLGFWFAQQGSIFVFVVLIFVYARRVQALERRLGLSDDDEPDSYDLMNSDSPGEGV